MWNSDEITIELDQVEDDWLIVTITTPVGRVDVAGSIRRVERILHIEGAHIGGLEPGALGRAGLNAIGGKLLKECDVDKIYVQGGNRTTGRNKGRRPRRFCFPHD